MKKNLLLFLLMALGLSMAYYSSDLTQKNPETVFLTTSGISEYEVFKSIIPERKVVIFKYELKESITLKTYEQWSDKLQDTLDKHERQFDFITPKDLFTSSHRLNKAMNEKVFPKAQINLIDSKFLAFLAIEKKADTDFHSLIEDIKSSTKLKLHTAGIPFTNFLLDNYSRSIKEKIFPLMFTIAFLFILIITKKLLVSIALFLPCLFSAVICLSAIKFFYTSMNMVTSIIPLMCFTITLAMVFHLFFMMRQTNNFKEALNKKLPPIILMVITTCIGFGSLMISDIQAISDFGKLSLFLIFITALFALAFMQASEHFLVNDQKHRNDFNKFKHFFHMSFKKRTIAAIALLSICIGSFVLGKIDIITDATRYFPKDSGLKASIDSVNQSIVGIPLYDIILETGAPNLENMKRLESLETELSLKMKSLSGYQDLLSLNSMVKSANKSYSGDAVLPDQIIAFQTLRSKLKPAISESFPFGKNYKISLIGKAINVDEYERGLSLIKDFFAEKKLSYELNGLYYNLMISQKSMINILFKSFLIALLIVSFIAFIYLKRGRVFFIFLLVNIIPVFASFVLMYLFDFSINIATVMTYSIALGMIVDSSFHLIHNLKMLETTTYEEYYSTTIIPIIGSSLLLIGSFSLFGFNGFLPIKQFGLNLSIILFLGLIFDLFLLPTLFIGSHKIKEAFDVSNL